MGQTPQVTSTLQPAKSDLEIFLRDRQFGIGTPQGGLAMTTALKAHLMQHPTHVVACLDFKNAFGSIDRTTCVKVLRELCPQNPAWLDAVNIPTGRASVGRQPGAATTWR